MSASIGPGRTSHMRTCEPSSRFLFWALVRRPNSSNLTEIQHGVSPPCEILPYSFGPWPVPVADSEERWKSGGLLAAVIALNLGSVYITVLLNLWYALFYNALQERNFADFSYQLLRFSVLAGIFIVAGVYRIYLRQMLQIRWRNWLTQRYVARWLQNNAYYTCSFPAGRPTTPTSVFRRTSAPS